MSLNETIERITRMEKYFDALEKAVQDNTFEKDGEQAKMLRELTEYYDSGQWLSDYEKDEQGELPRELKRGVLSQDGIYNLLCDIGQYEK